MRRALVYPASQAASAASRGQAAGRPRLASAAAAMANDGDEVNGMGSEVKGPVPAVIVGIHQETPTVKRFTLQPQGPLHFIPGQWVDFFIPTLPTVGGFSFVSTPRQLELRGTFELAVKHSRHPPAAWLHERAHVGDQVSVQVGGSFHFAPGDEARPLLLAAGGIGINPLFSILRHCCEQCGINGGVGSSSDSSGSDSSGSGSNGGGRTVRYSGGSGSSRPAQPLPAPAAAAGIPPRQPPHAVVLYSAAVPAELALRRDLEELQDWAGGSICLRLHATAPEWKGRDAEWGGHWGRIERAELAHALEWLGSGRQAARPWAASGTSKHSTPGVAETTEAAASPEHQQAGGSVAVPPGLAVLVCGPPAFEDAVIANVRALGVAKEQVRFERWW